MCIVTTLCLIVVLISKTECTDCFSQLTFIFRYPASAQYNSLVDAILQRWPKISDEQISFEDAHVIWKVRCDDSLHYFLDHYFFRCSCCFIYEIFIYNTSDVYTFCY